MMRSVLTWTVIIASSTVLLYSGMMGIFAAAGVCVLIWGTDILTTALGNPPDYGHPAIYLLLLLGVPSMLLGFAGGLIWVIVPICSKLDLKILADPFKKGVCGRICRWYAYHLQRVVGNDP